MNIFKNKNFKLIKHGFVMFSRAGSINHPHIVKGLFIMSNGDKKFVSVNATHQKNVRGHKTSKLNNNLQETFVINDAYYVRDINKYSKPKTKYWHVSAKDNKLVENILRNSQSKILH